MKKCFNLLKIIFSFRVGIFYEFRFDLPNLTSKNYNFYDPDIMTPTKEEKNKYLADSVFKLNA